jgi:hypothetical protein
MDTMLSIAHASAQQPSNPTLTRNGRRLVLVDIENLIGGAVLTADQVHWARTLLAHVIGLDNTDQVVIGTSHIGVAAIGFEWPNQRYVVESGDNGADLKLLEVLAENLDRKYDEIVLASGDGIFSDSVAHLTAAGLRVHVIAVDGTLARRLQMAATTITRLPNQYLAATLDGAA